MKYNKELYLLLEKYVNWAKFDWCFIAISKGQKMYVIDFEDNNKQKSIGYLINCILDNGMLDECFNGNELIALVQLVPPRFKNDIYNYIKYGHESEENIRENLYLAEDDNYWNDWKDDIVSTIRKYEKIYNTPNNKIEWGYVLESDLQNEIGYLDECGEKLNIVANENGLIIYTKEQK